MNAKDWDTISKDLLTVFREVKSYGLEVEVFTEFMGLLMEKHPAIKVEEIQGALATATCEWVK